MATKRKSSFTIYEARTHLSKLLKRVQAGEELIISHGQTPIARLVPFEEIPADRTAGSAKGMFMMNEDFDEPLPKKLLKHFT